MLRLIIPGEAVPQLRPRFARHGNYVQTYDPAKCRDYKSYVRMLAAVEVKRGQTLVTYPIEGPVEVRIAVYRHTPKSWSKAKIAAANAGHIRPTTKPDIDNIAKGLKDALKGLIWVDDSQVVRLEAEKWYGDEPRAVVEIEEVTYFA
ncbi:hypothetical protein FACS1894187_06910 [Synergistales bacterium]|nr:hypothetical protein FACS1894187_06910 [Synergistales bacterium]